jgi:methylated-DNA-protein-cysteine methyltransferase-like protein
MLISFVKVTDAVNCFAVRQKSMWRGLTSIREYSLILGTLMNRLVKNVESLSTKHNPFAKEDSRRRVSDTYRKIWQTVKRIPKGRVASYGQIARVSGFTGQARLVGYALHSLPPGIEIPWHRVINSRGRISFPHNSLSYKRQRELLEKEGVVFMKQRIDLSRYGWKTAMRRTKAL